MIRVTIELCKHGNEKAIKHLGTAYITNDGTGDKGTGNYKIRLSKWGEPDKTWKSGELKEFNRVQFGAWDLLCLCLISVLGDRVKKALAKSNKKY